MLGTCFICVHRQFRLPLQYIDPMPHQIKLPVGSNFSTGKNLF